MLNFSEVSYLSNTKPGQLCRSFMKATFPKDEEKFDKNNQCHVKWRGLSNVCAKSEPAGYKNNNMQEINV